MKTHLQIPSFKHQIKYFSALILFLATVTTYGQTYQTLNKIVVPVGRDMVKKAKASNCTENIPSGQSVEIKKEYKNSSTTPETSITVTETKTGPTTITVDKPIEVKLKSFHGFANIYADETEKSKIHINYWLNGCYMVESGLTVVEIKRTLQCDGTYSEAIASTKTLTEKTPYPYWRSETTETNEEYFKNTDVRYEVKDSTGKLLYYLINKYDSKADYTIELTNREYIKFKNTAVEFGPVTIPIKYRFGSGSGATKIKEEFTSEANLGLFAAYKMGYYRARYERGVGFKELPHLYGSIGVFLSASAITLNKANTNGGDTPIMDDSSDTIGALSPGIGLTAGVYGFTVGTFIGWDIGIGENAKNWNYNSKPWIGIGLGYSLTGFWKK